MNALGSRNCSNKAIFRDGNKCRETKEEFPIIPVTESRMGFLSEKLSDSREDLLECSYEEFEKDLKANHNSFSSSISFVRFDESNVSLPKVKMWDRH